MNIKLRALLNTLLTVLIVGSASTAVGFILFHIPVWLVLTMICLGFIYLLYCIELFTLEKQKKLDEMLEKRSEPLGKPE